MASILVVDDEPSAEATAVLLGFQGWFAEAARSGSEALERLEAGIYDAVVLDRNMPGMKGDMVLQHIHASPHLRHLCVVMLTGHGDIPNAVECLKLGAWQYLQKPVSAKDLKSVLMAGIAVKRCDAIRTELLSSFDRKGMLENVRRIASETMEADGLHIVFLGQDGKPVDILGQTIGEPVERRFWKEIMDGKPLLWTETEAETAVLEPLLPGARSLIAVPVRGDGGVVTGVLDVESIHERFFAMGWRDTVYYLADLISLALALEEAQKKKQAHQAAEERIVQLGQLHRELGHSIATYVQTISLHVQSLKPLSNGLDKETERKLKVIKRNADSVQVVIGRLREAAEDLNIYKTQVDVATLLRNMAGDFAEKCKGGEGGKEIQIGQSGLQDPILAIADGDLIELVLRCLLQNAIESIEDRRDHDLSEVDSVGAIDLAAADAGAEIIISVRDNGIGFDPKAKDKIFQPLFSTKRSLRSDKTAERENQGMGLFTAWRVVNGHGGSIEASSKGFMKGATFQIRLPKGT